MSRDAYGNTIVKQKKEFTLSPKQIEIFKFFYSDYDFLITHGSIRSGKTVATSTAFIMWAMATTRDGSFLIAGKTTGSLKRNVITPLMKTKYLTDRFDFKHRVSTNELIVTGRENGKSFTNIFYLGGANDERSFAKIQGLTVKGVLMDEVVLFPESFFKTAIDRASMTGAKICFTCNPSFPKHWFYQEWIKKAQEKNALVIHFVLDDNESLDERVKQRLKNQHVGAHFNRYILGQWVAADGMCYPSFPIKKQEIITNEKPKDLVGIRIGLDFGGNKSAHAFVASGMRKYRLGLVALRSHRIEKELDPSMLEKEFVDFCRLVYNDYGLPVEIRGDSAEPVLMRGILNAVAKSGLPMIVKNAYKSSVNGRISFTNKAIGLDKLKIYEKDCKTLINALEDAIWDDKADDDVRLDNGTSDIDTLDAFEYSFELDIKHYVDSWGLR